MKTHLQFALALTSALTTGALAAQEETHLLRYQFQKGATGHFALTQNAEMKMEMGGQPMETVMNMEMFMTFEILDVTEGNATMKHTLDRVKVKMVNPAMGTMEFDSADEDSRGGMFAKMYEIVGTTMKITVDPRGRTSNVEMSEEMESAMGGGGSAINVEQMLSQFMAELPEEPIAVGGTWQTKMEQAMGKMATIDLAVDNTLLAIDGSDAKIGQVIKMKTNDGGGDSPLEATVKSAKGELSLDLGTGLPEKADMAMEMDIITEQSGMEVQVTMKMNVEMRRTAAPASAKEGEKQDK